MKLALRYDMRRAPFSTEAREDLYRACIDQCVWADKLGFELISLAEHHGAEDGYNPSTMILGSAIAGSTRDVKIALKAILLPLHDPIRMAEDLAVLDLISKGRLEVLFGAGYRPIEYQMFGLDIANRGKLMSDKVQVVKNAWTGMPFEYNGTTIQVTPAPYRQGGPPITFGGSTHFAARRAALYADAYDPVPQHIDTFETYRAECAKLGKTPSEPRPPQLPAVFVMVSENPEAMWKTVAPFALHESNSYGQWNEAAGLTSGYVRVEDPEQLRRSGAYRVLTPEQCVAACKKLGPDGRLILHPLLAGMPIDLSWESLRLFERAVIPELRKAGL